MGEFADDYDYDYDYDEEEEEPKTCFMCGRTDLAWLETKEGWRLSQDGETVHVCTPDVTNLFDIIE